MKAYYIHWNYSSSSNDTLFYMGKDDDRLFHSEMNASACARIELERIESERMQLETLYKDLFGAHMNPEKRIRVFDMANRPDSYSILSKEIIFED